MKAYQPTHESCLAALADPTRRAVFELLADGPRPVGRVAAELPVSRPAVSQHLRVLKEAGLVIDRADGNRRLYALNPDALEELRGYVETFWARALTGFKDAVEKKRKKEKGGPA